jgi:hypothetical protein
MKHILKLTALSAILLFLAGGATSCKDKEEDKEEKEKPFLTVDKTSITAPAEGGGFSIVVNSNGEWSFALKGVINRWCLILSPRPPFLRINNDTIVVLVMRNVYPTPRSATVEITLGNFTDTVVINQDGRELSDGEIPLIEHFLVDYSIQRRWTGALGELFVVNNDEELENQVLFLGEHYPKIDFSKYTLLLMRDNPIGGGNAYARLWRHSTDKYDLDITIQGSTAAGNSEWRIAVLAPKIPSTADITVNIEFPWR